MFMIYWTQNDKGVLEPKNELFGSEDMRGAMTFMEDLRKRQHAGEPLGFIGMVSENPNCVGKMGVDVTGSDYNWTKRRSTVLRKDVIDAPAEEEQTFDEDER
jgi:hypothetical protein